MIFLLMSHNSLPVVVLPVIPLLAEAQTSLHSSPDEAQRAVITPVGKKGDEEPESRFQAKNEKELVRVNLGRLVARRR